MADTETDATIKALEADLGIPEGFVNALAKEDDWSFIVKAYALVEAAITQLLLTMIDQPKIADDIALLPIRTKLSLMASLEMLDGRERACVQALSSIRNRLAHNISHVGFDLKKHVDSLPEADRVSLAAAFHPYRGDDRTVDIGGGQTITLNELIVAILQSQPKLAIHDAVVLIVALAARRKQTEAMLRAHRMTVQEFANRLMRPLVLESLRKVAEGPVAKPPSAPESEPRS